MQITTPNACRYLHSHAGYFRATMHVWQLTRREADVTVTNFRHLFIDEYWRCLQSSVVLVCRDAAVGWSDDHGWEAIGRALAGLAEEWSLSNVESDLALSVVTTLSEESVRGKLVADVRSAIASSAVLNASYSRMPSGPGASLISSVPSKDTASESH